MGFLFFLGTFQLSSAPGQINTTTYHFPPNSVGDLRAVSRPVHLLPDISTSCSCRKSAQRRAGAEEDKRSCLWPGARRAQREKEWPDALPISVYTSLSSHCLSAHFSLLPHPIPTLHTSPPHPRRGRSKFRKEIIVEGYSLSLSCTTHSATVGAGGSQVLQDLTASIGRP